MRILAFDVGGTAVKSAVVMGNGEIFHYTEHPCRGGGRDGVLDIIYKTAQGCDFDAIGISTAGLVDMDRGEVLFCSDAIPNYTGTKLKEILQARFKRAVWVVNDVNAAALGEAHFGAGSSFNDFICLTFGTSIGGAIVIDKSVYGGKSGYAGEIGHIATHYGGLNCVCGSKGCYGMYASVSALVDACSRISPGLSDGRSIFEAFTKGNAAVKCAIDSWIDEVVVGLVLVTHIFDPPGIILGGGIMQEKYITDEIGRRLHMAVMPGYKGVEVHAARLGNRAGLMGAAKFAAERLIASVSSENSYIEQN